MSSDDGYGERSYREKVEGSDGIGRVPCDRCRSADESALEGPAGTDLLLCPDCYDRYSGEVSEP